MAAVDDLFAELAPTAATEYSNYVMARTPPALQSSMAALVATALSSPLAPAANKAMVTHGANIVVQDNGGGVNAKSPGVANVTLSTLNFARLAA